MEIVMHTQKRSRSAQLRRTRVICLLLLGLVAPVALSAVGRAETEEHKPGDERRSADAPAEIVGMLYDRSVTATSPGDAARVRHSTGEEPDARRHDWWVIDESGRHLSLLQVSDELADEFVRLTPGYVRLPGREEGTGEFAPFDVQDQEAVQSELVGTLEDRRVGFDVTNTLGFLLVYGDQERTVRLVEYSDQELERLMRREVRATGRFEVRRTTGWVEREGIEVTWQEVVFVVSDAEPAR